MKKKSEQQNAKPLLKGVSASRGVVVGKAKIILSPKDVEKFEKGDILIVKHANATPISTPSGEILFPLVKKASAVITDGGNPANNIAVFCREIEIPCIVGTEKATKVLKDGDTVIVDGTKGVVYLKNDP